MQHVFHPPITNSFEKVGVKGKTFDVKHLSNDIEVTLIETEKGHETKIREKECAFLYFILDGNGGFEIEDEKEECSKGDLVVIPKNTAFQYAGTMKMLLIASPWWYPEQEETLPNNLD